MAKQRITGGPPKIILPGTESNFKQVLASRDEATPNDKFANAAKLPVRGYGNPNISRDSILKTSSYLDVTRNAPLFNDPRYTSSTLSIPTDNRTLHGLYRFFTETDPIVGASLKMHSELPLANVALGTCEDEGIQRHFDTMWDRINGTKLLTDMVSEYYEIGDCFPFGAFNETDYMWDQFAILNPDYVKIESTWLNQNPLIKLIPDENLKKIVQTRSPRFIYDQLPQEIVRYVLFNREIPLDPNNVFHLSHAKRPYELRGRSLIKRILKMLMLEDRFNQANFALATRHAVPLTVVKVGDPQSLEQDHFVVFKENEVLKVMTFNDMWGAYDGIVTRFESEKEVKDVSSYNLFTQSMDDNGNLVWNKIEDILRHPTPNDIVEVQTPNAIVRSTKGHGFVRLNPDSLEVEEVTPEELNDEYSTILSLNKLNYSIVSDKIFDTIDLTKDFAYLMGLWAADGYINGVGGNNSITISNGDIGIQNYLKKLPQLITAIERTKVDKRENDTVGTIFWKDLKYKLIDYYGFTESGKKTGIEKVPNEILFNSNPSIVGAFFAGVIDGDGFLFRNSVNLGVSCGASREYQHFLSLALLAQGITSRVRSYWKHKGSDHTNYELHVTGKNNLLKLYNLITPYLNHSKKSKLCQRNLELLQNYEEHDCSTNVFKVSDNVLFNLFPISGEVMKEGKSKERSLTRQSKLGFLSKKYINKYGLDCYEKSRLEKFYGVSVYKVKEVEKSSDYVYDLVLRDDPHYYLAAKDGWLLVHNTGWTPNEEELNAVRDLFSAWELDPNFSIFYHYGIDVQFYGSNGRALPVGPELDRIYRLKFIGLQVHEQLLAGGGGSYSQAYINLEVQRQRYLNLQLKLEQFLHEGLFKPVADLCGFYRVHNSTTSGHGGAKKYSYGKEDDFQKRLLTQFTTLRDLKDNEEFLRYIRSKLAEHEENTNKQEREYVFPKIDWGAMSAASDENLKNYVKWLAKERPYLIDDATLARLAKLDRDTQEDAYMEDLRRAQKRFTEVNKEGLLPFAQSRAGKGGGDFGGDVGMPLDMGGMPTGGGPGAGGLEEGGVPNMPTGAGGAPETAGGQVAPAGTEASIKKSTFLDDNFITSENKALLKEKENWNKAIAEAIIMKPE